MGIYENFSTDIFRKIVGSPIESTPKTKTVHSPVFGFAKTAIFTTITLYKSAEMVVTVRGCGKIVHAGDVGPPLMGRTDGALDIEAL